MLEEKVALISLLPFLLSKESLNAGNKKGDLGSPFYYRKLSKPYRGLTFSA